MTGESASVTPVRYTPFASPLGPMLIAARDGYICGIWFEGQKHFDGVQPDWHEAAREPVLLLAGRELGAFFEGRLTAFSVPVRPVGTVFQQRVWEALRGLGFGERISYGDLARRLQAPEAVRAVAAAIGRNPVSIILPCHRVIGANGNLTGYAGGLARKARLLELERTVRETAGDLEAMASS